MSALRTIPAIADLISLFNAMDEYEQEFARQQINPALETWDDIDLKLHECGILADLAWDLSTEINYDGPREPAILDRLVIISAVTRDKVRSLSHAVSACELRHGGMDRP